MTNVYFLNRILFNFFQKSLGYSPYIMLPNDNNNNLQPQTIINYSSSTPKELANNEKHNNIAHRIPDTLKEVTAEKFSNVTNWEASCNHTTTCQKYSTSNQLSPAKNCLSSKNTAAQDFDFPNIISRERNLRNSRLRKISLDKSPNAFQNNDDLSNLSSPDLLHSRSNLNSAVVEVNEKKKECLFDSFLSNESRDSNSSVSNDKEDLIPNQKDNIESNEREKPYKCDDCGKGFSQMRNYKYHR